MSAPTSRPVHPCVVSLTDSTRGAEFCTWAHMSDFYANNDDLPNLVTASANSINIYSVDPETRSLLLQYAFGNLAGVVVSLATLSSSSIGGGGGTVPDALLVGFAGHSRLTVLTVQQEDHLLLQAATLLDLTPAVTEHCFGAVTVLKQDMVVAVSSSRTTTTAMTSASSAGQTTAACILGGGVAVAVVALHCSTGAWTASEPYILPLSSLELPHHIDSTTAALNNMNNQNNNLGLSMSTGFGDILDVAFLPGFLEPVVVLLHTSPTGRTVSGRLGSGASPCYCTAMSVSVPHNRTAVLWCVPVPSDATHLSVPPPPPPAGGGRNNSSYGISAVSLVVVATNSLTVVGVGGRVQQCLAVNGWARSSSAPMTTLSANPAVPLAVQLDGARVSWVSHTAAVVALRRGQLYVLQMASVATDRSWSMFPTGQTLGAVGEVSDLVTLPFANHWMSSSTAATMLDDADGKSVLSMGFLFAGSRLGDSLLLSFALETVEVPLDKIRGQSNDHSNYTQESDPSLSSFAGYSEEDENEILRMEDEAMYGPASTSETGPDLVPPSDDDTPGDGDPQRKRARLIGMGQFTVVRSLTPVDCLVNLGPLGPSCEGPLGSAPIFLSEPDAADVSYPGMERKSVFGAVAHIFPSGYGSSGGVALVTVPGRDDRMIVAEEDSLHADCIFSLPIAGVVLLGMSSKVGGGIRVLRMSGSGSQDAAELSEVYVEEWCSETFGDGNSGFSGSLEVFQSTLLSAAEYADGRILLLVRHKNSSDSCAVIASHTLDGGIEIVQHHLLKINTENLDGESMVVKLTPIMSITTGEHAGCAGFGCLWSSGDASVVIATVHGDIKVSVLHKNVGMKADDVMDVGEFNEDSEERDLKEFYADGRIVAIDVFSAPAAIFERLADERTKAEKIGDTAMVSVKSSVAKPLEGKTSVEPTKWSMLTIPKLKLELQIRGLTATGRKADLVSALVKSDCQSNSDLLDEPTDPNESIQVNASPTEATPLSSFAFDGEDDELYAVGCACRTRKGHSTSRSRVAACVEDFFVAVCRKSGDLEIYSSSSLGAIVWNSNGVNLGVSLLTCNRAEATVPTRLPRSHKVSVDEMRFFFCGPTAADFKDIQLTPARSLCVSFATSEGDLILYKFRDTSAGPDFRKVPFRSVARPSQEQTRHHAKLARKGVVGKDPIGANSFAYNILNRFTGISGQDGLFAAVHRPLWFVCERGRPTALAHRTRHAAPAGGKPRPIAGFCSGLRGQGGYVTLHERVGRVGSQRLTLFKGLSNVFTSHGLLPGCGYCVEKIALGVTVRRIVFLDDENMSTGDHPLYAVLVSREVEVDQSELNSDGLSDDERQQIDAERNASKIHRQVEADLGGFDIESEWVEAIERENCFHSEVELGGAPPIHQSAYSLWIVDASNKWMVVDSYEFGEHEHGLDLKVMSLTEFKDEPGSATAAASDDCPKRLFVTVGTGIVNHDGEDVGTKGRALLFEVRQISAVSKQASSPVAELVLAFEKDIFHGPVTTLSCLMSEAGNRLVIGAGSDVNVEQWGNGKLTQVGFFRATMHVMDIMHFKNFLLLSDAFDSMYFLVWRESDKSLTLLAKDYDPIPVYAAGIMTRGTAVTFLCHDDRQNLQFFQYAPGEAAARGGNKLVCRADYHLGSQTTSFRSFFCRPSLLVHSATPVSTLTALKQQDALFGRQDDDQRLGVHFGTIDGSLGSIVPLSEPVYWRLMALQSVMSNALESDCALSNRAWRLYQRTPRRGGCRSNDRRKGVIDGDLVLKYADLATTEQEDLASAVGSSVGLILDNLLEVQCASMIM